MREHEDDHDGMTEEEHERLHADDPEEAPEPEREATHPDTTPDEGG